MQRVPSPMPLTLIDNPEFSWPCLSAISNDCLVSLKQWDDTFPKTDKNEIVMPQQTYEGLRIIVSLITASSGFYFYIKLDTFNQIFLGL